MARASFGRDGSMARVCGVAAMAHRRRAAANAKATAKDIAEKLRTRRKVAANSKATAGAKSRRDAGTTTVTASHELHGGERGANAS